MSEEKHTKNNFKKIELYSVLILIATLFMSIGYAEITGVNLIIDGKTEAVSQKGIFITDVVNTANISADTTNSKINYYVGTMLDSTVVLGNAANSSITYEVTVYNKYDTEYVFIGVITDTTDSNLYSNADIIYDLDNIEEYVTTIPSNESITFTITFKYKTGADLSNITLASKLNFRFQEIPKLVLSNDGKTYELNNIYPGYTPQEYSFTVSNYDDSGINNVPTTYSFETAIDSPLTAKIYNSAGTEVSGNIAIEGDGTTKVDHTYTIKISWDDSISDYSYSSQAYSCSVSLKATPDSDKYLNYKISKGFNVNIATIPFYFDATVTNSTSKLSNYEAYLSVTTKNNNDINFNQYATTYEISIEDNDKFIFSINGIQESDNKITKTLNGGSLLNDTFSLKLIPNVNSLLSSQENITLVLTSIDSYRKEIRIPITITHDFNGNLFTDINRDTALVPTGFDVSSIASEKIVTEGLVITDTYANEYVWIPIFEKSSEISWGIDYSAVSTAKTASNSSFTTSDYDAIKSALESYTTTYNSYATNNTFVDEWYGDSATAVNGYYNGSEFIYYTNGNMTKAEYQTLYNNMLVSVYKNGGFYVARYEMGIGVAESKDGKTALTVASELVRTKLSEYSPSTDTNTSTTVNTNGAPSIGNMATPVSKPNSVVYTCITQSQAQMLAEKVKETYGYGNVTTSLLFGVQWDAICVFFEHYGTTSNGTKLDSTYLTSNENSKLFGNYYSSSFTMNRGYYSTSYASSPVTWNNPSTKTSGNAWLCTSGASEQNKVLNVYDMAGNLEEWTLEYTKSTGWPCAYRGGSFDDSNYIAKRGSSSSYSNYCYDAARCSFFW